MSCDISIRALGLTRSELTSAFGADYGKGGFHAEALFRHLYTEGNAEVSHMPEYAPAPLLAAEVEKDHLVVLPHLEKEQKEGKTQKFTLGLADGSRTESVVIPMADSNTLCVSSQVGCLRGCTFCETARMGFIRNLDASEIVAQWAFTRFTLGITPRNLVYMGMGEPFDNFDDVVRSIRILSDPKGAGILKRRISISTSGHVEGIRALTHLENEHPEEAWRTVRLAVSLNAPNDSIRDSLMPINRQWGMNDLKSALMETPQSRIKDGLYFEYVVIPGVNDSTKDAQDLSCWMKGMLAKVNIIPYHPRNNSPWQAPDEDSMNRFHGVIRSAGVECRTRRSRGTSIEAACGMLGAKGN